MNLTSSAVLFNFASLMSVLSNVMFMHSPEQQLPKGLPSSTHIVPDGCSPPALSNNMNTQLTKLACVLICFLSRSTQVPEWSKGEVLRSSAKAPGFEVCECPSLSRLCFSAQKRRWQGRRGWQQLEIEPC